MMDSWGRSLSMVTLTMTLSMGVMASRSRGTATMRGPAAATLTATMERRGTARADRYPTDLCGRCPRHLNPPTELQDCRQDTDNTAGQSSWRPETSRCWPGDPATCPPSVSSQWPGTGQPVTGAGQPTGHQSRSSGSERGNDSSYGSGHDTTQWRCHTNISTQAQAPTPAQTTIGHDWGATDSHRRSHLLTSWPTLEHICSNNCKKTKVKICCSREKWRCFNVINRLVHV